jgi:hypothetical protein
MNLSCKVGDDMKLTYKTKTIYNTTPNSDIHYYDVGENTLCSIHINNFWYVVENAGKISLDELCKKCLKIEKEKIK